MSDSGQLYCYRLVIDRRGLALLARDHGHPARSEDIGYQIHALLAACFGKLAPALFTLDPEGRGRGQTTPVLAYGTTPWESLLEHARATAQVQAYNAIIWGESACKPMPDSWRSGASYHYSVRVCPVRRRKRENGSSREVDAFLASPALDPSDSRPVLLRRQAVYEAWLREQVEGRNVDTSTKTEWQGGAHIETCSLVSFRLARFLRHDASRSLVPVPDPRRAERQGASGRPDATLSGVLTVTDGSRFARLLARGVGRHRAFGFGMLLLKRG